MKVNMNRASTVKINPPSHEVFLAERQAEESSRRLESTLDRIGELVQGTKFELEHKVEAAATAVEQKVEMLCGKLDEGVVQIDLFVQEGKQKLDETLSHIDHVVMGTFVDVNLTIEQAQSIVSRVRGRAKELLTGADRMLYRVEDLFTGFRGDLVGSSENILGRAEKVTQKLRAHLSARTEEINRMIDRAERTLEEVSDPVAFIKKNPGLGISGLLLGGILVGAFFRKLFPESASVSNLNGEFPIEPVIVKVDSADDESQEAA